MTAFRRLGGTAEEAQVPSEAQPEAPAPRTPYLTYDFSVGWKTSDNLILLTDRVPVSSLTGQIVKDVGQTASADLGLVFPISERLQYSLGFGASTKYYNDAHDLDEAILLASAGFARAIGNRTLSCLLMDSPSAAISHWWGCQYLRLIPVVVDISRTSLPRRGLPAPMGLRRRTPLPLSTTGRTDQADMHRRWVPIRRALHLRPW